MVTAPFISDGVISATLDTLNAASPAEAAARQERTGQFQPELTAFVAVFTLKQRAAAAGIGLFIMLVLYEAFRASAVKVRKARERVVLRHWRAARDHAEALRVDVDGPMSAYQMVTRTLSARTMGSPLRHPKARANSGMFTSGPLTRQCAGPCGSVAAWSRAISGRSLAR